MSRKAGSRSCAYANDDVGNVWLWAIDGRHRHAELRIVVGAAEAQQVLASIEELLGWDERTMLPPALNVNLPVTNPAGAAHLPSGSPVWLAGDLRGPQRRAEQAAGARVDVAELDRTELERALGVPAAPVLPRGSGGG